MEWLIISNVFLWVVAGTMCAAHADGADGGMLSYLDIIMLMVLGPMLVVLGIIYGFVLAGLFWIKRLV